MKRASLLAAALVVACGGRDGLEDGGGGAAAQRAGAGCTSCAGGGGSASSAKGGAAGSVGVAGCGGRPGPPMIAIAKTRGMQCIDATEVTNAHYAAFLASAPTVGSETGVCANKVSFVPAFGWPAIGREAQPVVNVDWCDARAYCAWAGKVLCPGDRASPDATQSAWTAACSRAGERTYPYGDAYAKGACNGNDLGLQKAENAGSLATCEGGYAGLFDMSGNVWEWEDACDDGGPVTGCLVRGGSFRNDPLNVACGAAFLVARDAVFDDFGFRCCAP